MLLCPVRAEGELWALTAAHSVHKTLSRGTERLVEAAKRYYGSTLGSGETGWAEIFRARPGGRARRTQSALSSRPRRAAACPGAAWASSV